MMRMLSILAVLHTIGLVGCAHSRLSCNSTMQAQTLTEIQEQQVLDNIAMFVVNTGSTPYFALPNGGGTLTNQSGTISGNLIWNPTTLTGANAGLNGNAGLTENWTLKPINEPERLNLMKCVYQHVTCGQHADECKDCVTQLVNFFGPDFAVCEVPSCWYNVSHKKPRFSSRDCCVKVGHYCGTYVIVEPEFFEYLSRVTISILDIATVDSLALANRLGGSPKFVQIEETFEVADGDGKRTIKGTLRIPADVYDELKQVSGGRIKKGVGDLDKRVRSETQQDVIRPRRESGSSLESLIQLNQGVR